MLSNLSGDSFHWQLGRVAPCGDPFGMFSQLERFLISPALELVKNVRLMPADQQVATPACFGILPFRFKLV